jgi:hypothetical protein
MTTPVRHLWFYGAPLFQSHSGTIILPRILHRILRTGKSLRHPLTLEATLEAPETTLTIPTIAKVAIKVTQPT